MAYIYQIINDINDKVYVGKTEFSLLSMRLSFNGKDNRLRIDNAIRKWCQKYNLPSRRKDIKSYSDEEWEKV